MFGDKFLPILIGDYKPLEAGQTDLWYACPREGFGPVRVTLAGVIEGTGDDFSRHMLISTAGEKMMPAAVYHTREGAVAHCRGNVAMWRRWAAEHTAQADALAAHLDSLPNESEETP